MRTAPTTLTRRRLLVVLSLAGVASPAVAASQPRGRPTRIGVLDAAALDGPRMAQWDGFRRRLRELGYREGEHVVLELRSAQGHLDRLDGLAGELARTTDLIVAATTPAVQAARRATATLPIVMTIAGDPVGTGLVASLAHPGGNVTGLTTLTPELTAKRLEILRAIVPTATRVAILGDDSNPSYAVAIRDARAAAPTLGVTLVVLSARSVADIERAFAAAVAQQANAVIVQPATLFFGERRRVVELAARHRLPAAYAQREYIDAGGLVAYGTNLSELFVRAAPYVAKILTGSKAGDLPIEQPTRFELVVNLRTARALGLAVPSSVLAGADHVIE